VFAWAEDSENGAKVENILRKSREWVATEYSPKSISLYMLNVLKKYKSLQKFKPEKGKWLKVARSCEEPSDWASRQLPRLPGHTNLKKSTSVTIFSRDVLDPLSLFCRRRSRHKQVLRRIKV